MPDYFPGEGAALLWFDDFSLHPAYFGVLAALKNATRLCDKNQKDKHGVVAKMFAA